MNGDKIIIAITGASGAIYAKRFLDILSKKRHLFSDVAVVFSENGKKVWNYELGINYHQIPFKIYENDNLFVPFASGSSDYNSMVILPCSMSTLSKIANGISDNLITRSADVMLKERRKLVLVPREMPYNLVHIENMRHLVLSGANICPASPSFYSLPKTLEQAVDTVLQKVFALLDIEITFYRWQGK